MRRVLPIVLLIAIAAAALGLAIGCGSSSSSSSSSPASSAATGASIKVGVIADLGSPIGLETSKGIGVMADEINKSGGLDVGDTKYQIELVEADSKASAETAKSAVEKLIQQDKVQFMIGDETTAGWVTLTEAAKIPVISLCPVPEVVMPKYMYSFQGSTLTTQFAEFYGWFAENNPDIKKIVLAMPDNQIGEITGGISDHAAEVFGFEIVDKLFYPPAATDFTAIAAKVKSADADGFIAVGGGPQADGLVLKSVVQSGYQGNVFQAAPMEGWFTSLFVPLDQLNGMEGSAYAVEQNPMPPVAQQFMDAYKAKYPDDLPEPSGTNMFSILTAGLQKAGSVDGTAVADALSSGMDYESPIGLGRMIARPDVGNDRTVDTLIGLGIKKIENGEVNVFKVLTVDEGYAYAAQFYGWK